MTQYIFKSRNMLVLFIAQLFGITGTIAITFIGGIVGNELYPSKLLATLPIAALVIGGAIFAMPSALLMKQFGRKFCFLAAAVVSGCALIISAYAVDYGLFGLFCFSSLLVGVNGAFMQHYRFAAFEGLAEQHRQRGLTLLLLACAVGVYLGVEVFSIAKYFKEDFMSLSFYLVAAMLFASVLALAFYQPGEQAEASAAAPEAAANKADFWPLVLLAAGAFSVMSLVMVPTPLQMTAVSGHSFAHSSNVMQVHLLAMYLPSIVIGLLLKRTSPLVILNGGFALLLAGVLVGFIGHGYMVHMVSLALIGVGWCFVFVVSTTLVAKTYAYSERFKAQAKNDMVIFCSNAAASLSAGSIALQLGWGTLLFLALAVVLVMSVCSAALSYNARKAKRSMAYN